MYSLLFQKIYDPYRVVVSVDKTKDMLYRVYMNYHIDSPYQVDSNDKYFEEKEVAKVLAGLRKDMEFGSSKLKKLKTKNKIPLSQCVIDLCNEVEKNYPWVRKVRSYLPRETPSGKAAGINQERSLLVKFPLRMPFFNYLHKTILSNPKAGEDPQKVTYYLDLAKEKAEGCIEVAPGMNGTSFWDGDLLNIDKTSPNNFLLIFREKMINYLRKMNEKQLALFDPERDEKCLERFIIDSFSEFYAGNRMPCLIEK